ncbi:MAG: zinc-binding alcohol dehydrogenase family protein [Armatimonadota bacterium]
MRSLMAEEPGKLVLTEADRPTPGAGEVVVRVHAVGICGSDVHIHHGNLVFVTYPRVPGHELSGVVAGIGAGVDGFAEGDRVAVNPTLSCGECYPCSIGRGNCCVDVQCLGVHCDGAFREYLSVAAGNVHDIPDDMSFETGALIEPLSIGLQATQRGRVAAEDTVAIIGAGTIGLCALQQAKVEGATVAISDACESRLKLAESLGADLVVDVREQDFVEAVQEWTRGRGGPQADGANVVIEAVGVPETLRQTLDLVSAAGRVVVLGIIGEDVALPASVFIRKELDFLGSRMNADLFPAVIRRLSERKLQPEPIITHTFAFDDVLDAFELASKGPDEALKILVKP